MPDIDRILTDLGITLPEAPKPVAAYVPARLVMFGPTGLLYVSGQLPLVAGSLMATGRVPSEVSPERAVECARQCAINILAIAKSALGSLARVRSVVRLGVWVASDPGFAGQPKIGNGASELMVQVFGEAGRHARASVGSVALPNGTPVEVEAVFEVSA